MRALTVRAFSAGSAPFVIPRLAVALTSSGQTEATRKFRACLDKDWKRTGSHGGKSRRLNSGLSGLASAPEHPPECKGRPRSRQERRQSRQKTETFQTWKSPRNPAHAGLDIG